MLDIFAYNTFVHFTDQNWISKTVYCIKCVMIRKIGFTNWNAKIALLSASMVLTYFVMLNFSERGPTNNGILMSLLLLVAEARAFVHKLSINYLNLKVQSCELYSYKYMMGSTQITNTEVFAFIAVLVFKLLSPKFLFMNRKDNRNC